MKLKPIDLLNEIRMHRALRPNQSALLLEGRTDCSFFRGIACKQNCRIYPTKGKVVARKAAKLAMEMSVPGVLAILDRDHDEMLGQLSTHDNLVYTDENDLEIMIVKSSAFERTLNEYFDYDDRERITSQYSSQSISDILLTEAGKIGVLRLLNTRNTWELKFRALDIDSIFDPVSKSIDESLIAAHLVAVSSNPQASVDEIREAFFTELSLVANRRSYATGHDVTKLFSYFLSSTCLLYTSPSPRDRTRSRMPSSA